MVEIKGEVEIKDDKAKMMAPGYVRPNHPHIPVLRLRIVTEDLRSVQILYKGDFPGYVDIGDEVTIRGSDRGGVIYAQGIFNNTTNSWVTKKPGQLDCFIATVVYGSPFAEEVMTFRRFRDQYLHKNFLGRKTIDMYYKYSPSIAARIENKTYLKSAIRFILLQPLSMMLKHMHFTKPDGEISR